MPLSPQEGVEHRPGHGFRQSSAACCPLSVSLFAGNRSGHHCLRLATTAALKVPWGCDYLSAFPDSRVRTLVGNSPGGRTLATIAVEPELWYTPDRRSGRDAPIRLRAMF